MKNLVEMKRLARMARNIGQPDLALEEAIAREEKLAENLFNNLSKTDEKPIVAPLLVEKNLFTEEPKVEVGLVEQAALAIKAAPVKSREATQGIAISNELTKLRKQLSDVMAKIGTMSWGGGGTGVVRFTDLDDHRNVYDVDSIHMNTSGADANSYVAPGILSWNTEEDCLNVHQEATILQVGLESYIRVHNHTGATLPKGTFVMFAGVDEPHPGVVEHTPMVAPYLATAEYPPIYTVGVLTENIANGEIGRATTFGKVRNLDTTGASVGETWQRGDLLWASATIPGALTRVQPTVPFIAVSVAVVLHVGASDGVLLVRPTIFPQMHTGKFFSNTNQTAAQANTAYAVTFNNTTLTCGHITIDPANTANVVIAHQGYYDFEFQLQVTSTNSSRSTIWIWVRQNGTDVPESATKLTLESNGGVIAPSWSFTRICNANDVFQLMWAVDSTNVSLQAPASTAFCPATPSATLKVRQVNL